LRVHHLVVCCVLCTGRKLNSLDMRLHKRALELLEQQREKNAAAGSLQALPKVTPDTAATKGSKGGKSTGTLADPADVARTPPPPRRLLVTACMHACFSDCLMWLCQ
jgi:hypothetical protein